MDVRSLPPVNVDLGSIVWKNRLVALAISSHRLFVYRLEGFWSPLPLIGHLLSLFFSVKGHLCLEGESASDSEDDLAPYNVWCLTLLNQLNGKKWLTTYVFQTDENTFMGTCQPRSCQQVS